MKQLSNIVLYLSRGHIYVGRVALAFIYCHATLDFTGFLVKLTWILQTKLCQHLGSLCLFCIYTINNFYVFFSLRYTSCSFYKPNPMTPYRLSSVTCRCERNFLYQALLQCILHPFPLNRTLERDKTCIKKNSAWCPKKQRCKLVSLRLKPHYCFKT